MDYKAMALLSAHICTPTDKCENKSKSFAQCDSVILIQ